MKRGLVMQLYLDLSYNRRAVKTGRSRQKKGKIMFLIWQVTTMGDNRPEGTSTSRRDLVQGDHWEGKRKKQYSCPTG